MRSRNAIHNPLGAGGAFESLPPLAGQFSGPAIVLGRGGDWITELDIALEVTCCDAPIVACNAQSGHYPGLEFEHVASIHCRTYLAKDRRNRQTVYHSAKPYQVCPHADVYWAMPGVGGSGSSALLATLIALSMGFDPVFVAGVHLDSSWCETDCQGKNIMHDYRLYRDGWKAWSEEFRGHVFSVSPKGSFLRDLLEG